MAMTYFLPIVERHSEARPVIGRDLASVAFIIVVLL